MFQGVHMMLDGDHQREWREGEKRESRVVFIGRNLPEEKIRKGFESTASPDDRLIACPTAEPHIPSIVDRIKPVAAGAPVVAVHFLGGRGVFALGEETLLFVAPDGSEQRVPVHAGGILAVACDGARIADRRRRRQGRGDRRRGESETLATDDEAPLDRSRGARARRRGCLGGRQAGVRAHRQGRGQDRSTCLEHRRARVRAEGPARSRSRITAA